MAGERAQRPRGDALHQRVARIVVAEATDDGERLGWADEGRVPTCYPAAVQAERRPKPIEGEPHHDASCIGIVGKHVTHRDGVVPNVIREGEHDVILL